MRADDGRRVRYSRQITPRHSVLTYASQSTHAAAKRIHHHFRDISERYLFCIAVDERRGRLYVMGGFGKGGEACESALWMFDTLANKWSKLTDETPGNFLAGQMVYAPARDQFIMFGGNDTNTEHFFDLDKQRWKSSEKASPVPARGYLGLSYDTKGDQLFIYGGTQGEFFGKCVPADLWSWSYKPNHTQKKSDAR